MSTSVLGVQFVRNRLYAGEIERSGGRTVVRKLASTEALVAFDFDSVNNSYQISTCAQALRTLVQGTSFQTRKGALALESRFVLIKKIPMDRDASESEVQEQARWETEQFILAPVDEYVFDYAKLPSRGDDRPLEVAVVAVRRAITEALKKIFLEAELDLRAIDVDLFAAERAFKANYDFAPTDTVVLIEVGKKELTGCFLRGGEYVHSQELLAFGNEELQHAPPAESLARSVSKELKRVLLDHQLGQDIKDLSGIYLFGDEVTDDLLEELRDLHTVRVERVNPFRKLTLAPELQREDLVQARPEAFTVSVGTALRQEL